MTAPARYTKRPVTIDAYQFTGGAIQAAQVIDWVLEHGGTARYHEPEPPRLHSDYCGCDGRGIVPGNPTSILCPETEPKGPGVPEHIAIDTLEGTMRATEGDWVIRGVKGEHYPCKPDVFADTYEPETPTWREATRRSLGAHPAGQFIWWGVLACGCPVAWTSQHPDTLTAEHRAALDDHVIDHWDLIDSATTKVDPSLRHPHRGASGPDWDAAACERDSSYIVEGEPVATIKDPTP